MTTRHCFRALGASAVLALPLAAAAQYAPSADSTMQVYGRLDASVNVQHYQGGSGTSKTISSDTSLIGFRGTENLGGGLWAYFKFEHGFFVDSGTQGNAAAFWNREAFVGLKHATFGSVELGTHYLPVIWITGRLDPFGRAQTGASFTLLQTPANRGYPVQFANSVEYISPTVAGLTARVLAQAPEGTPNKNIALGVEYTQDRWFGGVSYDNVQAVGTAVGLTSAAVVRSKNMGMGLSYRFDAVKLSGWVQHNRLAGAPSVNGYFVGATVPFGAGEFRGSVMRTDRPGFESTLVAVGYAHFLSRRTQLYTSAARLANGPRARFAV